MSRTTAEIQASPLTRSELTKQLSDFEYPLLEIADEVRWCRGISTEQCEELLVAIERLREDIDEMVYKIGKEDEAFRLFGSRDGWVLV